MKLPLIKATRIKKLRLKLTQVTNIPFRIIAGWQVYLKQGATMVEA